MAISITKHRGFLLLWRLVALFVFAIACDHEAAVMDDQSPALPAQAPNIVLIMADDLGYEGLSANGSLSYTTPNLDALAAGGMRFRHAYSTPVCTPTRVQLMTGKYNHRNYVGFGVMKAGETTFGHLLQDAGYATGMAGKWQLFGSEAQQADAGGHVGTLPEEAGFDAYNMWWVRERGSSRYKDPYLDLMGVEAQRYPGEYGPDIFADSLLAFFARNADQPFFAYYPMLLTHSPFLPTPDNPEYADLVGENAPSDPAWFKSNVAYMDKIVGRLVDGLEDLGIRDNTLIMFIGDNGTHRQITSQMPDGPIVGDKSSPTDAGTHVPMIANWPAVIQPGGINDNLIDFTDFIPTMMDAAQTPLPASFISDGLSFYDQLLGDPNAPTREWVFCHYDRYGMGNATRYVHNRTWKLYASGEIYNIADDPLENAPILEDDVPADVIESFRDVLVSMQ